MIILQKRFLVLACLIFLSCFVSANGIVITNSTITTNKTAGIDLTVQINIENQEPHEFINISFETNDYIEIDQISSLASGQNITIDARIITNQDISESVRLKGYFLQDVSHTPLTEEVYISYNDNTDQYSVSQCDFTLIEGDSVRWHNNASSTINARFAGNNQPVDGGEISTNQSFTKNFPAPELFSYYFAILSFPITPICDINVLDSTGYVNDPNLDGIISLNIDVEAEPTNVSINVPIVDYTIKHNEDKEGAIFITNEGEHEAVGVELSESTGWFVFDENDFNIPIGDTKIVNFRIDPILSDTNDTDKNYTKTLKVRGNFDTREQNFSINIPFASISPGNGSINDESPEEVLERLFDAYCRDNPNTGFCQNGTSMNQTFSDEEFNISMRNQQFQDLARAFVADSDERKTTLNIFLEALDKFTEREEQTNTRLDKIEVSLAEDRENRDSFYDFWAFTLVVFLCLFVVGVSVGGIFIMRRRKKELEVKRYGE